MPPIPAGYVLLKFVFTLVGDTEEMITTIGAESVATDAATRLASLNDQFDNWNDNVLPRQSQSYTLQRVDGIFGDASGDIPASSSSSGAPGHDTDQAVPQNTSVLVRKLTGVGGRENRGRMYVPGVTVPDVTAQGTMNTTPLANWQTAMANLLLGIESAAQTNRAVIFHSNGALSPTIVQNLQVQSRLATQRRRLRP